MARRNCDFSERTKHQIILKSGFRCALCGNPVIGLDENTGKAVEAICWDGLESVRCRSAHYGYGFPHRYQSLMEELLTFRFDPHLHRAKTLNVMEAEILELFHTGTVFGLAENNKKELF